MKSLAIASHVACIGGQEYDGIGNVLKPILKLKMGRFIYVRHSMEGLLSSEVQEFYGSDRNILKKLDVVSRITPLRYVTELIQTVRYFSVSKNKVDVFIGIDPLNALAGVLLKKLGRIETAIFYTADYSPTRFNNKALNWVYHKIDAYCVKYSDEVWSVSTRIVAIRSEMGLSGDKNIFIPNVPPPEFDYLRANSKDRYRLITYGIIDKQLDFEVVFKALRSLGDEFKTLSFTIVGNGPQEIFLKQRAKEIGVLDRVHFLGKYSLENTLEQASISGIGLALYTGAWGFNYYGDSTKCREYFNFGLPVISTDTHSTVQDIKEYNAGIIIDDRVDSLERAIRDILNQYEDYSKNSARLGVEYSGVHERLLKRILD